MDEMVLERLSITLALSLRLDQAPLPALGDPALVELVLSDSAGEAERSARCTRCRT
ncbi:hypothetical protein [Kibdelosporangium phytohabitans]|uniref:hypothetical protein n=1 Tax=Kibdelosporangium phytohabitans TaxID=860235 RepID=UPI0019DDA818|nr:hypothetical protein [Kibdelosporangium phytohabitans]MBE1464039.1 hypothetical protein [Kibdelosporangium phytohabitans]